MGLSGGAEQKTITWFSPFLEIEQKTHMELGGALRRPLVTRGTADSCLSSRTCVVFGHPEHVGRAFRTVVTRGIGATYGNDWVLPFICPPKKDGTIIACCEARAAEARFRI